MARGQEDRVLEEARGLHMLEEDPMAAIIGAVGKLTAEEMEPDAAMELVLGILRDDDSRPS